MERSTIAGLRWMEDHTLLATTPAFSGGKEKLVEERGNLNEKLGDV